MNHWSISSVCHKRHGYLVVSHRSSIGYYAIGTKVNFVAITRPPSRIVNLFNHDLAIRKERAMNLVHIIRLCGVISGMADKILTRTLPEFQVVDRYVPPYSRS
jgi:hypothetical protein